MEQISKLNHTELQSRAGIRVRNGELIDDPAERQLLYEWAESDLELALSQQPYDPTPLEGLSHLYISWGDRTQSIEERTKKYHQALDQINRAISLSPGLGYLHHRKGDLLVRMGHFEEAVNILQVAISLDPDYLPGYQSLGDLVYLLAEIEREKKQFEKALEYYRKALKVFSTATDIRPDFEKGIRAREEILDRIKDLKSDGDS
jgi:tetratricopeptide (TPR) repeat protein